MNGCVGESVRITAMWVGEAGIKCGVRKQAGKEGENVKKQGGRKLKLEFLGRNPESYQMSYK